MTTTWLAMQDPLDSSSPSTDLVPLPYKLSCPLCLCLTTLEPLFELFKFWPAVVLFVREQGQRALVILNGLGVLAGGSIRISKTIERVEGFRELLGIEAKDRDGLIDSFLPK